MVITMINRLIKSILTVEQGFAHCDVPCGIYDPYPAQIDAHTILRMMDLIAGLDPSDPEKNVKFARYIATKEEHGESLKTNIRVIFGDFMAPGKGLEEKHPTMVDLFRTILSQASKTRQTASRQAALDLIESVNKFSEIFWAIKGKETRRVPAPYPTNADMVLPA
jgi:nickel superoxide dismutase